MVGQSKAITIIFLALSQLYYAPHTVVPWQLQDKLDYF
jgi:hypothetical protein